MFPRVDAGPRRALNRVAEVMPSRSNHDAKGRFAIRTLVLRDDSAADYLAPDRLPEFRRPTDGSAGGVGLVPYRFGHS
jgi:hypothetical protein